MDFNFHTDGYSYAFTQTFIFDPPRLPDTGFSQGWAKVTGKPLAVCVHSNVGLMHATMAIFNAWCDRMPVVVLGATGPVDAPKRRPWIDWIHTARDQGSLVRGYIKWDDQPASPAAAREAVLRASWLANAQPQGPSYVNLDAAMQEMKLEAPLPPIDASRYLSSPSTAPAAADIEHAARLLRGAQSNGVVTVLRLTQQSLAFRSDLALPIETLDKLLSAECDQHPKDHDPQLPADRAISGDNITVNCFTAEFTNSDNHNAIACRAVKCPCSAYRSRHESAARPA